jgi:tRNA threonylcarbamoyladenosine biosynthesis protein TsaB
LILAVDTSGSDAGLVLVGGGRTDIARLAVRPGGFSRTEDLAAETAALLAARGAEAAEIGLLGAVVGPGSYTGLRSGLAFLRGLAFADSLSAVAVGTLELLAWRTARSGEGVVVFSPAGPGRFAVAAYRRTDDVDELAPPRIVEELDCTDFLAEIGRGLAAVVVEHASAAATSDSPLSRAAREAGLELRIAERNSLEKLAVLVESRGRRAQTVRIEALLPIYVGQASARPNSRRVAVFDASK